MKPTPMDILSHLTNRRVISLVGGGGKTTLMYRLARELKATGKRVVTTTTTKIYHPRIDETGTVILTQSAGLNLLDKLEGELEIHDHVTLVNHLLTPMGKMQGIEQNVIGQILEARLCDHIIVEADGAARRPIKAPAAREPVLPAQTDLLIAVVGLDVVGKPLDSEWVHRVEEVGRVTGLVSGEIIRPEHVAKVIAHPQGLMKDLPSGADSWIILNKADLPGATGNGRKIAEILACQNRRHPQRLIIGSAERKKWVHEMYTLSEQGKSPPPRDIR